MTWQLQPMYVKFWIHCSHLGILRGGGVMDQIGPPWHLEVNIIWLIEGKSHDHTLSFKSTTGLRWRKVAKLHCNEIQGNNEENEKEDESTQILRKF